MTYVYLLLAIVFEVVGTAALQASEQFTRPKPVMLMAPVTRRHSIVCHWRCAACRSASPTRSGRDWASC